MRKFDFEGFTLVELAIVLIIIGLITGGVIGAQSLINSANRQSIIKDYENYKTIWQAFRLEYDGIPGDLKDAYDYFGTDIGCSDADVTLANSNRCNGNGNGQVNYNYLFSYNESYNVFRHLNSAELISGEYTGNVGAGLIEPGATVPESSIGVGGYHIYYETSFVNNGNYMQWGDSGLQHMRNYVALPKDAYAIDKKIDDGLPLSGYVISQPSNNQCIESGEYEKNQDDSLYCRMYFYLGN